MPKRQRPITSYVGAAANVARQAYGGYRQYQKFKRRRRYASRTPQTRRRYQRSRYFKGQLTQKKIKKKLRAVCQFMKQQNATHIHRQRMSGYQNVDARHCAYEEVTCGGTKADIETAMSNLRFFDAGVNGLVVANPAVGTYHRDIRLSIFRKLMLRNNYQIPCMVKVYSCHPKVATQKSAYSLYVSGLADQGAPDVNSPLVHLSDSQDLKDVWNVKLVKAAKLMPGAELKVNDMKKLFKYEISTNDEHGIAYDPKQGGHVWIIRVCGVLAHDSVVAGEVKQCNAAVDWMCDVTYKFEYDAGKDLHDVSVNDATGGSVFTNVGLVSQLVTDNQAFSST